jgi:polysaccharide biosynthesis transport protein
LQEIEPLKKNAKHPAENAREGTELVPRAPESALRALRQAAAESGHPLGGGRSAPDNEQGGRRPAGSLGLYLHAFRRHWPLAISLGIVCAGAAMASAWFLSADRYTAVALLQIAAGEKQVMFQTHSVENTFDIYRSTQQQLLTSDNVLTAALRNENAAKASVLQKEDDPVRWLARNVHVDFPGNAEIMRVSLTGPQPEDVAILVGAVVDAYMKEVANKYRDEKRDRLNELDRLYKNKSEERHNKENRLKELADQLKTNQLGTLALKEKMAWQAYEEARNDLYKTRQELQHAKDELAVKLAWRKALDDAPKAPAETESLDESDPLLAKYFDDLESINSRLAERLKQTREPFRSKLNAKDLEDKEKLQKKIAERRAKLKRPGRAGLDPEIGKLQYTINNILEARVKEAVRNLEEKERIAKQYGEQSIDVEEMQAELRYLDKFLEPLAEQREKLNVELGAAPRITVFQPHTEPDKPIQIEPPKADPKPRVQGMAVAGLGSFFGVVLLVLWWDVRKETINSLTDLSRGLGLTVVGAVPLVPQKVLRGSRASSRHLKWQNPLNEAVDSIAARLFLRKAAGDVRVVMVSSAMQGEGKTTLAVQLATRLARSGEPTLLVDYDLRRPTIHRIFGMSRGPGVSECLQKECEMGQVARPTEAENLSIITAGSPLADSLGPLSNGVTTSFFETARSAFTFVVVDGSPILPVIDGLLVSQHADTVVLAVRRDASQAPQVLRACEKLVAFGSRNYVVVLNGSHEESCPYYQEQVISARVEALPAAEAARARKDGVDSAAVTAANKEEIAIAAAKGDSPQK